ncbi:MAG: hypothetical protein WEC14_03065 [Chloroflexota bacterium]
MTQAQDPDPGERRLPRPPSDRYGTAATPGAAADEGVTQGSHRRALAFGAATAAFGATLAVVLGGPLALSAGLLVLWATAGYLVGHAVRIGAAGAITAPTGPAVAIALALAGVALAQVGLWWYAGTEGGVLPLIDFLAQTYGVLIPLQAALAAALAWWSSR